MKTIKFMKAIKFSICILIVLVPTILTFYFNVHLVKDYINTTNYVVIYSTFQVILIGYIIIQFAYYAAMFADWFDNKLK
jgi:antibiotic biosynthesis monooxygenase (ABM) superfamily enzyme